MFSLLNDSEMFLDIEGYEGLYSVSNMGRVYSHITNKILKAGNSQGYLQLGLSKDGIRKTFTIHILVGNAFIGKREGEMTFDHYPDRNKSNNCADNLRLATLSEQSQNRNMFKNNKTGEKNISICGNGYRIKFKLNGMILFDKYLHMDKFALDDAVKIRDDFLKKNPTGKKIRNVEQNTL